MTMITPAQAWRRPTEIRTLPSGKVAELKKPDIEAVIILDESGALPDALVRQVIDRLNGKQVKQEDRWQPTAQDLPAIGRLMRLIVRAAFVAPRIVDAPDYDAGEIAIEDVSTTDQADVFTWAMEEYAVASRFRG